MQYLKQVGEKEYKDLLKSGEFEQYLSTKTLLRILIAGPILYVTENNKYFKVDYRADRKEGKDIGDYILFKNCKITKGLYETIETFRGIIEGRLYKPITDELVYIYDNWDETVYTLSEEFLSYFLTQEEDDRVLHVRLSKPSKTLAIRREALETLKEVPVGKTQTITGLEELLKDTEDTIKIGVYKFNLEHLIELIEQ